MIQGLLNIFGFTLFLSVMFSAGVIFGCNKPHSRRRIVIESIVCVILLILTSLILFITFALSAAKGVEAGVVFAFIFILMHYATLLAIVLGLIYFTLVAYSIFLLGVSFSRLIKLFNIDSRMRYALHTLPFCFGLFLSFQFLSNTGFENIYTDKASGVLARVEIKGLKLNIPPISGLKASPIKGSIMMAEDEFGNLDNRGRDIVKVTRFNRVQIDFLNIPANPESEICFSKTETSAGFCSGAMPKKTITLFTRDYPKSGWTDNNLRNKKDRLPRVEIDGQTYLYNHSEITSIEPLKIGKSTAYFSCRWLDRDLKLKKCLSENKDIATCEKRIKKSHPPECTGHLELRPGIYQKFEQVHKESLGKMDYEKALKLTVQDLRKRVAEFENFVSTYGVEVGKSEED